MFNQDDDDYRRWRQHGEQRGWFESEDYGMRGAQQFHEDSLPQGPINRWSLGMGQHYGRGPRNYQRNDQRIRDDVIERLTLHGDIDASDMQVEVNNGEVTLKGMVETRRERRLAEDIAEEVFGVKHVQNFVKVSEMIPLELPNPSPGEEVDPNPKHGGFFGHR